MNRSSKTAAAVLTAAGFLAGAWSPGAASAAGGDGGSAARDRVLWGAVTIPPGRDGVIEAAGFTETAALGAGSTLTLAAPAGTRVTGVPTDTPGYRGALAADGRSAVYTATSAATAPWRTGGFRFVLAVSADAVPGTRLNGCVLRLADAQGAARATGGCQVTVGLTGPVLTRPESGVPLDARPTVAGSAHPGAQVTVTDKDGHEVCADTAAPDGRWSCTPGAALPDGPNRLQATGTLNGVSAASEQIQVTVGDVVPAR
ncbi:Ig-like domain-containing protein [Streptomyces fungicidicus]|uniref:Ig-like domain-containing protein n=1 Tax=Streptomyces fungicidicus TaxID=68203 RepID=UPI0036352C0A